MSGQTETIKALYAANARYQAQVVVLEQLGCRLHAVGMELPPDLSFEDWLKAGRALFEMERINAEMRRLAARGLAQSKRGEKRNERPN
jgi:hypothetical protein